MGVNKLIVRVFLFVLFFAALPFLPLGCSNPEKKASLPSASFAGKKFSILMLRPPATVNFSREDLNRLIWKWSEFSPGFQDQLVGVSEALPSSSSLPSLLDSLERRLKSRSELLIILYPRKFYWGKGGKATPRSQGASSSEFVFDEADFLVSLADLQLQQEIGVFPVYVSRTNDQDDPILDKLAYEIASKVGFGWRL